MDSQVTPVRRGRPRLAEGGLNRRISLAVSEEMYQEVERRTGYYGMANWLRDAVALKMRYDDKKSKGR